MGRRPNQLVSEFFLRGRKLEDASNRYEHTCKRCGEVVRVIQRAVSAISNGSQFPKGRLDSMLSHLLRRCSEVTQSDRENVFMYLQSSPSGPVKRKKQSNDIFEGLQAPKPRTVQVPENHVSHHDSRTQFGQLQQQSALETLAEVSRRHLDFSSQRRSINDNHDNTENDQGRALAQQALMLQLNQAPSCPSHSPMIAADIIVPFLQSANTQPSVDKPDLTQHSIDPQLGVIASPMLPQLSASVQGAAYQANVEDVMMWNPTNSTGRQSNGMVSAPSETPAPGFGLLQKNARRAARGRFSDSRRKEVQEIRKRGACIRCRMLKKSCSEGTPCNTCASVESARLWKGKCLRTRLAEEFGLWSTGLVHTTAKIECPAALNNSQHKSLPGCIEARLFKDNNLTISFSAKHNGRAISTPEELDPYLTNDGGPGDSYLLLDANDNLDDKIEAYFNAIASMRAASEPSNFMRATILKALDLVFEEQAEQTEMTSQPVSRSCYNLQHQLLNNVVELWLETSILMAPELFQPCLRYNPNKAPHKGLDNTKWDVDNMSNLRLIGNTSTSYHSIKIQLLTAMESRCSKLAKTVINELERRLLQRQQVSRFSTFIAAVLLLNCVERITSFYHALDSGTMTPEVVHGFRLSDWPLDETPDVLWPQGEHFASLLITLLRMRALPPVTRENSDGTLSVAQDYSMSVHVSGKPVKNQIDDQVVAAADWLNPLQLNVAELRAKRDCDIAEVDNRAEAWDMRLISQVLLPE